MAPHIPISRLLATGVLGLLAVSCGDEGPRPTPLPGGSIQSVRITGPDEVEPGTSVQYAAILRMADGTELQATTATWASSPPSVVRIDASGLATTTMQWGLAFIHVSVAPASGGSPLRATREVIVQPRGTFRIAGKVTEADNPGRGISGVLIEVRASEDLSAPVLTSATANAGGFFNVFGAPPQGVVHFRREGYQPLAERYQTDRHILREFHLHVGDGGRLSLEGTYTMIVEASRCDHRVSLPAELRRRQYTAVITQSGANVTIRLSDAAFHVTADGQGNRFSAVVNPTSAEMQLAGFYDFYYYPSHPMSPDVAEVLPDGSVLVVSGSGTLVGTNEQLSGTLGGLMNQYERPTFPSVRYVSGCSAPRVTLTRR